MLQNETYRPQWEALTGSSYESFGEKVLAGLPAGTALRTEYWGGGFFALNIDGPRTENEDGFSFRYMVTPGESCKFEGAKVPAQGGNVSALVTANIMRILHPLGITAMHLHATEVGAYLWNRAGFAPYPSEWKSIAPRIGQRLDHLASRLPAETVAEVRKALRDPDPKSLWAIAERQETISGVKLGKALTLEWSDAYFPGNATLTQDAPEKLRGPLHWNGACDFKDIDCKNRFTAYAASGRVQAPQRPASLRPSY